MKRERNLLLVTAALSLVLGFVPGAGSGVMGVLALPFVAAGWGLRALSLSGGVGNVISIILYALICAVPLVFWWRSRRRTEDALLVLLSGVLAVVLYYMVNPNLRQSVMQNEVGDAVYAGAVWSTLVTWGLLKLLYTGAWNREKNVYRALRIFLLLCAASCLVDCFGTGTARIVHNLRLRQAVNGSLDYTGLDMAFLVLTFLAAAVEKGLCAWVLYRGAALLEELERDPFGAGCVAAAERVSRSCRDCLTVMSLTALALNIAQILLAPLLRNIAVSVSIPVLGMAVCFALLTVTRLLVRGKELKDDNDLFV